jgi:hypothetical protein
MDELEGRKSPFKKGVGNPLNLPEGRLGTASLYGNVIYCKSIIMDELEGRKSPFKKGVGNPLNFPEGRL